MCGQPSRANSLQQSHGQGELVDQLWAQNRDVSARLKMRDEEMSTMLRTVNHLISENSALKARIEGLYS